MPQTTSHDHTLCEPAQSKCSSTCHKSHSIREFRGKMPFPRTAEQTLCEPAQSKCRSTYHKSRFIWKLTGQEKCRSPEPRRRLCANLCSRNAHQHVTGAALYGNLQENAAPKNADTHFVRASLRSRNAHGHVTRGILCGNFQGKCRMLPIPPRLNTGP